MRTIPRALARAPIPVFKAGLGWLFGGVLVMVEHTGRCSGRRRYVVLEVVIREPDAVVVAAGFGRRSQWFRNIEVDGRVRLWCGATVGARAIAEVLPPAEARALLERYRHGHPLRARFVAWALGIEALTSDGPLPSSVGVRMPLVRVALGEHEGVVHGAGAERRPRRQPRAPTLSAGRARTGARHRRQPGAAAARRPSASSRSR